MVTTSASAGRRAALVLAAVSLSCVAAAPAAPPAHAVSTTVVLNEVYTRGGSARQPFATKFVELFNAGDAAVALAGHGLGYSAATNGWIGQTCALTGTIPARGHYLVAVGSNGPNGAALSPDQTCANVNPSGTAGAYTLTRGSDTVDLVGWGTAVRSETRPAAYPAGAGSIARTAGSDTDDNLADFGFTTTVTPQGAGAPTPEPPPTTITPIAQIQGTGAATPQAGATVTTRGVVTAAYPTGGFSGFYLQTPGTGGAPKAADAASDGLFVYGTTAVEVGRCYTVTGRAGEYGGLTRSASPSGASPCARPPTSSRQAPPRRLTRRGTGAGPSPSTTAPPGTTSATPPPRTRRCPTCRPPPRCGRAPRSRSPTR